MSSFFLFEKVYEHNFYVVLEEIFYERKIRRKISEKIKGFLKFFVSLDFFLII